MDTSDLSALLGEDASAVEYRDLWVVPAVPALVAEARRLADGLGCYLHAVVADEALAAEAIALGADRVHVALDAVNYLAGQHPEFVLLPAGQEAIAARLAQRLGAGLITRTPTVEIDPDTRALRGAHPVYGGEYALDLEVTTPREDRNGGGVQRFARALCGCEPQRRGVYERPAGGRARMDRPIHPAYLGALEARPARLSRWGAAWAARRGVALARQLAGGAGSRVRRGPLGA